MAREGFIKDKLDIKFLILFVCSHVIEPIPFESIMDLTMCDDGVDYFLFSECLADLVCTEHLTIDQDGLYVITAKGIRNSQICESSLPYSVRMKADRNIADFNQQLRRRGMVKASVTPRSNGTYTLSLSLSDDLDNVMKLDLMVAREDMAKELQARFKKNAEVIYSNVLNALFDEK